MNRIVIICLVVSQAIMQDIRYLDEVFDDVIKTEDVVYGNAPDLPFLFLFEWNPKTSNYFLYNLQIKRMYYRSLS